MYSHENNGLNEFENHRTVWMYANLVGDLVHCPKTSWLMQGYKLFLTWLQRPANVEFNRCVFCFTCSHWRGFNQHNHCHNQWTLRWWKIYRPILVIEETQRTGNHLITGSFKFANLDCFIFSGYLCWWTNLRECISIPCNYNIFSFSMIKVMYQRK